MTASLLNDLAVPTRCGPSLLRLVFWKAVDQAVLRLKGGLSRAVDFRFVVAYPARALGDFHWRNASLGGSTPCPITPGLLVLQGNRLELLREAVFDWTRNHPLSPLEDEVLLVQSNGVAEWLKMALAVSHGICAATRVELPARFLWRSYRQGSALQRCRLARRWTRPP